MISSEVGVAKTSGWAMPMERRKREGVVFPIFDFLFSFDLLPFSCGDGVGVCGCGRRGCGSVFRISAEFVGGTSPMSFSVFTN
jgi:hypothetical protein